MKMLIVTQAIDTEDPVLGFFVRWVEELAKHAEHIEVICLKEGVHRLPSTVQVHSLGKERGAASRATYAWRFLSLAWRLRDSYDAVFVHMNQEYILLGGWLWRLLGKRIYMWRNHYAGSLLTDLAATLCTKIFCTSKYSYTAKYGKTVLMPVGIDTERFCPDAPIVRKPHALLFLARMAPSKRPDLLIEALGALALRGVEFTASLYGSPGVTDDAYFEQLQIRVKELNLRSRVLFHGAVPHAQTPAIYAEHDICVNLSPSGMFDKTIFEAAACGCLALSSNKNLVGSVTEELLFAEGDAHDLQERLFTLLTLTEEEKQALRMEMRRFVEERHSLRMLGEALAEVIR